MMDSHIHTMTQRARSSAVQNPAS